MRKFQFLLFVLYRSYICYYIICMNVPLSPFSFNWRCILYNSIEWNYSKNYHYSKYYSLQNDMYGQITSL